MAANPDGCVIPMLDGAYVKLGACDDKSSLALLLLALVLSLCTAKSCCVLRGSTQRIMASAAFSRGEDAVTLLPGVSGIWATESALAEPIEYICWALLASYLTS